MSFPAKISLTAALMLSVAGTPALADLTVDDAWNIWKVQFRALGLSLDAEENRDGNALQIGKMTLSANLPLGAGSFSIGFDGPRFEPMSNGSVEMRLPEEGQFHLSGEITGEGQLELILDSRMDDYRAVMSGTPEEVTSEGSVGSASLDLASLTINGEAAAHARGRMEMQSYRYRNVTTVGKLVTIEGDTAYDGYNMAYEFEMTEGDVVSKAHSNGDVEDIKMTHMMALPADGIDPLNLHQQLRDGLRLAASGTTAHYHMVEEASFNGEPISKQVSTVKDYWQSISLDATGANWQGTTGAFDIGAEIAGMPAAIALDGAAVIARLAMPLLKSEDPQPAGFALELRDLNISEDLWAMADPAGQLPRDPLQLRVDLAGDLSVTHDLVDFLTLAELDHGETPVLPASLSIKDLFLSAVGGELTGKGAFTFDASDTQSFPGIPRPEGAVDLQVVGINTLMDRLVNMGLVPEDQVMGARMMMSMIMVPGDGEDVLTSHVEINDQGHVIANGQRLK